MFDIDFSKPTWGPYICIHILYLIMVLFFWKKYTGLQRKKGESILFPLLFLFFLLFAFDSGDYYHYYNSVTENDYHAMEDVYGAIGSLVNNNYILFRLIVWGGALLLFMRTAKRLKLDVNRTVFLLFVAYISIFDYARASLAMSIFFLGISYIIKPIKKRVLSFIIGILLIGVSVYFHTSIVVAIIASIIILLPINKKTFLPVVAGVMMALAYFSQSIDVLVNANLFSEEVNSKIEEYSSQEYDNYFSVFEWTRRYMEYATFFIPSIVISWKLYVKGVKIPKEFESLAKVILALILISLGILAFSNLTFVIFYRFLFMSMIPIVLVYSYCEQNKIITKKTYKFLLYLGITYLLFGFAKRVIGGNL